MAIIINYCDKIQRLRDKEKKNGTLSPKEKDRKIRLYQWYMIECQNIMNGYVIE